MGKVYSKLVAVVLLLGLVVLGACAPKGAAPAPVAAVPQVSPAPAQATAPSKPEWEVKWENLVAAARAEGKVVYYSTSGAGVRTSLTKAFKERFGIRLETVSGKGAELAEKLLAERRAGLFLVDVFHCGATPFINQLKPARALDPLEKELILPEVLDPKNWFPGEPSWPDRDRLMVTVESYSSGNLGINTNLVKPGEIKSLKDLLNPKWKGKIIFNDPTIAGTASKFFSVVAEKYGYDIWRQIAQQEPVIIRDQRLMIDWLSFGKYAIIISPKSDAMADAIAAGAPVDMIGVVEANYKTGSVAGLVNKAPHPNAARVFINWLLSREGQTAMHSATMTWSARTDVTIEGSPVLKLLPGVEYFDSNNEEFLRKEPERYKIAAEIFAYGIKK